MTITSITPEPDSAAWNSADDPTLRSVLTAATAQVTGLTRLAHRERANRPGLAEALDATAQQYAGQILDLIQRWPS